jgi:serine/threonine protein kinase
VYKCLDKATSTLHALKRIKLEMEYGESMPATTLREITVLRSLRHPNIVKLEHVIFQPKQLYLVFEFVELDLKKFLDNSTQPLAADLLKSYTAQLFEGLAFCHAAGVMHRDLKPANILIGVSGDLKIADFGLARTLMTNKRPLTTEVRCSFSALL